MWKWLFQKVVKVRERVAVDLGEGDAEKPFLEHLEDLRTMIVRMAITLCIFMIGTFFFATDIVNILRKPISMAKLDDKILLTGLGITDAFMTQVNASMMAGIILSFPLLLWYLLQFILPGLKTTEKKILFPALGIGVGLFLTGVLFAYYVVSPGTIYFFYSCNIDLNGGHEFKAPLQMSVIAYNKFITQFVMIFGACFETPVLVMALVKLDILSYKVMKTTRAYAIVAIAILAAVVTPTQDALTLGLLMVPMYVLYEICIWLAWWMEKKDRAANPEYYKGLDEDEKAMEGEAAEWDNEEYNPWSTAGDDSEEEEELKPKKPVAPTVAHDSPPPPPAPDHGHGHETPPHTPEHGHEAKPVEEKSLEESSREDENRNTD